MNQELIISGLDKTFPSPKCELNYSSDYTLLIAILLSAQCLDKNVNKVTPILFSAYPSLQDLDRADLLDIERIIHPLGLSYNKSKSIKKLVHVLIEQYNGKVPTNREILSSLPGIGIKTSGVFLLEFYHQNYLPVDTHIKRVSYRLGITKETDSIPKIEETLSKFFKYQNLNIRHMQLVLFGRYLCKSKNPDCKGCPFNHFCKFKNESNCHQ